MSAVPRGLRLHVGLFGRRNVGKSSLLNAVTRQEVAIVSATPGTTTDPVEKPMELLPLGPVLFVDTAGVDDEGALGELRIAATRKVLERTDLALLVAEAAAWGPFEEGLLVELKARCTPVVVVLNKVDLGPPPRGPRRQARGGGRRSRRDGRSLGTRRRRPPSRPPRRGSRRGPRRPPRRRRPRLRGGPRRPRRADRQGGAEGAAHPPAGPDDPRPPRRRRLLARRQGARAPRRRSRASPPRRGSSSRIRRPSSRSPPTRRPASRSRPSRSSSPASRAT